MIVFAIGIPSYLVFIMRYLSGGVVVEGNRDNCLGAFDKQTRVETLITIVGKIVHAGIFPFAQPMVQEGADMFFYGLCLGESANIKAETFCLGFDHIA